MKFVILSFILSISFALIPFSILHAQKSVLDSMQWQLTKGDINDTSRALLLNQLSFEYRNIHLDSSFMYAYQSLEISESINYFKGKVMGNRNIGMAYVKKDLPDSALHYLELAVNLATAHGLDHQLGDAYNSIGTAYYIKTQFDSALYYFEMSTEIFSNLGLEGNVVGNYSNIGSVHENMGDYTAALEYYHKALLGHEKLNHLSGIATVSYNIAKIYSSQQWYKEAMDYYQKTASIDSLLQDALGFASTLASMANIYLSDSDTSQAIIYYRRSLDTFEQYGGGRCRSIYSLGNLGELYQLTGNYDSAFFYLEKTIELAEVCDMPKEKVFAYNKFGNYYLEQKNYQKAFQYLLPAFDLAQKNQLAQSIASSAKKLYKAYKATGNTSKALEYLEIEKELTTELFGTESARRLTLLEGKYEIEKEKQRFEYEKTMSELQHAEALSHEKSIRWYYFLGAAILFIFLLMILWFYFLKVKANRMLDKLIQDLENQNEETAKHRDMLQQKTLQLEIQSKEIKDANESLLKIDEEKNTIIGIVAHDLKSPLNQINGLIHIMELELGNEPANSLKIYMDKIKESSERSVVMIDRILDISAIESKAIQLKKEKVNLDVLLENILEEHKITAQKKGITIKANLEKNLEDYTDPLYFREIIDNLLSNAIKFSPKGSLVELNLGTNGQSHYITVKDQGPGLSEEDQKDMFNTYKKVTATPTAGEKSTGLGLAIVKKYVEALSYILVCKSEVGKGTEFRLELEAER